MLIIMMTTVDVGDKEGNYDDIDDDVYDDVNVEDVEKTFN